ncbi:MAG: TolC family protein [Acidobacteriota bacterium]|nr:TolC family protein [Acidobacteriota bacterium]
MVRTNLTLAALVALAAASTAQTAPAAGVPPDAQSAPAPFGTPSAPVPAAQAPLPSAPATPSVSAGPAITLAEAIQRAQHADTAFATAQANAGIASAQRTVARSALLPGLVYHNQFLYTQPAQAATTLSSNGTQTPSVRFVANNAVHEYVSQGVATETIGGVLFAQLGSASASAAAARAQLEVARRGLVTTVVGTFYAVLANARKTDIATRALVEAQQFGTNTQQREAGGEVAHADVVRANLQIQQRQREINDARLAEERARTNLGIFLFPDPTIPYTLAASLDQLPPLPSRAEIETAAKNRNPDLRAAIETLRAAQFDVKASWFGYVPDLGVSVLYGIDAPHFAIHEPDGTRNLGYSAVATLDIPVFDWFATHARIRQSGFRREQARTDLTVTQRQLIASLDALYREAEVARDQIALLDQSVQTAAESLRLSRLRYSAGEGTVLEVVDAQTSLVTAEAGRVDGLVRYLQALASLQTLTGNMP